MKFFVEWIIRSRLFILGSVLAFVIVGAFAMQSISIDAVPDITNTQVMINSKTGSLSPSLIEREVTYPIELEVTGLPGVQEVRSLSKYGLSQVVVVFKGSVDIYWARSQIFERISALSFPNGIKAELAPITTGLGEVVMYTLEVDEKSKLASLAEKDQLIRLREIQDRHIRPELRRIEGVADVDTNGGYRKEIHINITPDSLLKNGLGMQELLKNLDSIGESIGGSYIQENGQQIVIGLNGDVTSLKEIESIPLKKHFDGRIIRVSDVASVRIESALRVGAATHAGKETVLGTVLMRSGENSRTISMSAVAALQSMKIPDGVILKVQYARSYLVDATIQTVTKSLIEGAGLVILILILLVGDLRSALIVAAVIPLSMLGAFIGMKLTGVSANLMSLGAIDFGLIVDGAVVMVENFVRNSGDKNLSSRGKLQFFTHSIFEVARPILFGVSIIILVYIPVLFLTGVEGKMFKPMAITVLFALASSLMLTMTFVPVMGYLMLKYKVPHQEPLLFRLIEKLYKPVLLLAIKMRLLVFAGSVSLLIGGGYLLFKHLGSDFVPQLDEGDLVIGLVRPASEGITDSIEQQKKAEDIIKAYPEVESVFSRMGTPDSSTDPMSVNFADTFVILKKEQTSWPLRPDIGRPFTKAELFEDIKKALKAHLPEQDISATQPIEMRFNEILEGSRADVTLRIYGDDLNQLEDLISRAHKSLSSLEGLTDIQFDSLTALTKTPVMEIVPNSESLLRNGASVQALKKSFETAMAGMTIGTFLESEKRLPIVLHLDESLRDKAREIKRIPINLEDGGLLPLGDLAEIKQMDRVTTIARSGGERYSAVSLFVKADNLEKFVQSADEKLRKDLILPSNYKITWGGRFKNLAEAKHRFAILVPLTLIAIFLLLCWNFKSWKESLLVIGSVPFAMVGGVTALWLRDLPLSIPAFIGFIALGGIAVLNAVVFLSYIVDQLREGMPIEQAVPEGAIKRLRPVLMTALVAALGFIPMAFSHSVGAEVQRPLATVVIGGIVSSTALTLILLPLVSLLVLKRRKTLPQTQDNFEADLGVNAVTN